MIRKIGSQSRERIEDTSYRVVWKGTDGGMVVEDTETGKREFWYQNDHHSGYTLEVDGLGYEFVSDRDVYGIDW